ncbi:hypothetical protein [Bdellovibrio bacteriovorus]|uniref:hypothetical protein n=1 Tax=Bdellovibrio bacteriovorus TaxID=959 RepID=UPI0035A71D2D
MVHGLEHFTKRLAAFREHYVIVGGVAGNLLMSGLGVSFRATKDLDIVVFMKPDPAFLKNLADYIKDGEFENREKSAGVAQYYRFNKPKNPEFPKQIELFSKKPEDLELFDEQHIIPLQKIEMGDQFSGILLEDDYYDLIQANAIDGDHCNFISAVAQIPLKARAFNELRERREGGHKVDGDDIRKHRNDILLLSQALPAGESLKISGLPLVHLRTYLDEMSGLVKDAGVLGFCRSQKIGSVEEALRIIEGFYF